MLEMHNLWTVTPIRASSEVTYSLAEKLSTTKLCLASYVHQYMLANGPLVRVRAHCSNTGSDVAHIKTAENNLVPFGYSP